LTPDWLETVIFDSLTYGNYAGVCSVIILLYSYFKLAKGDWAARSVQYLGWNIVGCGGMLISLSDNFNASAALMQVCVIAISLYGLYKESQQP
jgi:uncharacterized membrane protein YkvI